MLVKSALKVEPVSLLTQLSILRCLVASDEMEYVRPSKDFLGFAVPLLLTYQLRFNIRRGQRFLQNLIPDTLMEIKVTRILR